MSDVRRHGMRAAPHRAIPEANSHPDGGVFVSSPVDENRRSSRGVARYVVLSALAYACGARTAPREALHATRLVVSERSPTPEELMRGISQTCMPSVVALLLPCVASPQVRQPMPGAVADGSGSGCAVQGTWAMESLTVDGKPEDLAGWRQIKMVAGTHFTWVGQRPGPDSLQSVADSLAAYRNTGFGGGSYRVTDSTYTERIEFFSVPGYVGREITFSCRVVGDRWYHESDFPEVENGREVARVRMREVWRRVQ